VTRRSVAVAGGMKLLWRDLRDSFLDRRCPGCSGRVPREREICDACDAAVSRSGIVLCISCLHRAPAEPRAQGACPRHGSRRLVLAGPHYGPTLERIVRAFKYEGCRALAPWLLTLLPDLPAGEGPWNREGVLVPIPLHPARRAARSFDQALLLADLLSGRSGIPVVEALARVRDTPPQARLGPDRRHANVRGAFRAIRPELVRGRPVLLLDDVVTTGSTLLEAADVLEEAGAGWILSITAAHGGTDDPAEEAIQRAVATTGEVC